MSVLRSPSSWPRWRHSTPHSPTSPGNRGHPGATHLAVDGYTLALAACLLPSGALGDRYGRRGCRDRTATVRLASASPILGQPHPDHRRPRGRGPRRSVRQAGDAFDSHRQFPSAQRSKAVGIWSWRRRIGGHRRTHGSGLLLEKWSWHAIFSGRAGVSAVLFALAFTIPSSRDEHPSTFDIRGAVLRRRGDRALVLGIIAAPGRAGSTRGCSPRSSAAWPPERSSQSVEARTEPTLLDGACSATRTFGVGAVSLMMQFLANSVCSSSSSSTCSSCSATRRCSRRSRSHRSRWSHRAVGGGRRG